MRKHKSISEAILLGLEKSVDGYVRLEDFMYNTYLYNLGYDRPLKKSSVAQAIKRLREKGWVDFMDDQKLMMRLTEEGRNEILWTVLTRENIPWDGKWRIVMFDIPEERRVIRNQLRERLKLFGFTQFQKSVWISQKDCVQVLGNFVRKVGISDWVEVFEADKINFD